MDWVVGSDRNEINPIENRHRGLPDGSGAAYRINPGVDHLGTVGKVAPGLFAHEGRCWRMIYENQVCYGTHTLHAAGRVGRVGEVPRWLDESVVVRAARRRAAVGQVSRGTESP